MAMGNDEVVCRRTGVRVVVGGYIPVIAAYHYRLAVMRFEVLGAEDADVGLAEQLHLMALFGGASGWQVIEHFI